MKLLSAINENNDIVRKKYVDNGLALKQPTLVSGTNIKTINNQNILGSGNLNVTATLPDAVHKTGSETISGTKTFTSTDGIITQRGTSTSLRWYTYVDSSGNLVFEKK